MWVRHGECNRCGECCKSGDPFNGEEGVGEFPGACPLLSLVDGLHHCLGRDISHPYYVNGCSQWPSIPEHITAYPSCSFTFTWQDDLPLTKGPAAFQ
jgi:hypothetical protein